jgi:nicotinamidase/pyrazinamidase
MPSIAIDARDALVVIDVETDFLPGASPDVADDALAPLVNRLAREFANVVFTQGAHRHGQATLTSSDLDAKPFDPSAMRYGDQASLPEECGPGERGDDSRAGLDFDLAFLMLSKGSDGEAQFCSVYSQAEGETTRSLAALLKAHGISRVFACGLASNYCVARLLTEARAAGVETFVIEDACRAIDSSFIADWAHWNAAAVWRIQAREILG